MDIFRGNCVFPMPGCFFFNDNQIKICCKLSPLYLFLQIKQENIHDWNASLFFEETI